MYSNKLDATSYNIKSWEDFYPDFNVDLSKLSIHTSYSEFYESSVFKKSITLINKYLSYCLNVTNGKVKIYPYPDLVFNALNTTPLDKIKIVILGQDPYFDSEEIDQLEVPHTKLEVPHTKLEVPQAMGLSFSVPKNIKIPSSLKNIYKNLEKFGHIKEIPNHGNLSFWAYQGCLLLNTILTVQKKCQNGHKSKWSDLTDALIKFISDNTENTVFMLWGQNAYEKYKLIDSKKHKIIVSSHPSGLSCNSKFKSFDCFNDTDHFGIANQYLESHNKTPILWKII